jgi:hypothetical protein
MDDKFWFYIIAAVIWFLVRGRKKKQQAGEEPTESSRPQQTQRPVSFEDLLREITEKREQEHVPVPQPEPVRQQAREPEFEMGRTQVFADDETRRVYEESVRLAEGYDLEYEPDQKFISKKLFKHIPDDREPSVADEIREGLRSPMTVRKAVIYGEILQRRF